MAPQAKPANGFDNKDVADFIKQIEDIDDTIASQKASNAKKCRDLLDKKKKIFVAAKDADIPLKPLRAEIKLRQLDRQKAAVVADLEEEDRDNLEAIRKGLGTLASTPLGGAAIKAAEARLAH